MSLLCEKTAEHATHRTGDAGDFSLPEIRLALQDAGALLPEKLLIEEEWTDTEDLRGVEEFVKWFSGQRMKEIMDFARGDGEVDETDYLNGAFPLLFGWPTTFSYFACSRLSAMLHFMGQAWD